MLHHLDAINFIAQQPPPPIFHNSTVFIEIASSYHRAPRVIWFLPHVVGAIVWWNLYFVQLVPSIRRSYPSFHRWMGRALLIAAVAQAVSGIGMACTSHSAMIKIVSIPLGIVILYVAFLAGYYAWQRDIPRHKIWVLRLVGYLQTIAAQRFWMIMIFATHASGVTFLYPSFEGLDQTSIDSTLKDMFDGSFVMAILSATFVTEWYLAGNAGQLAKADKNGYQSLQ